MVTAVVRTLTLAACALVLAGLAFMIDSWVIDGLLVVLLALLAVERITASRHHRRELAEASRLAHEDELTGLGNRRATLARLTKALGTGGPVSLVLADLDDFKAVNDTYGHDVGDRVLQVVAGRLTGACEPDQFVSRLGGDEFAVVTEGDGAVDPSILADQLRVALLMGISVGTAAVTVGASIGVAIRTAQDVCPTDLLIRADAAMYRAKPRPGRSRAAVVLAREQSAREARPSCRCARSRV
jgi:diguanylate cyclase